MNVVIDGTRCRTTSKYDIKVIRALNKLEGMKKWTKNGALSFDYSQYNMEIWKQVFPDATVEGGAADRLEGLSVDLTLADTMAIQRPKFVFKNKPRKHQEHALEKAVQKSVFALLMDVGTGKSFVGVSLAGMRWCLGLSDHLIIIAPNDIQTQWVEDDDAPFKVHLTERVPWKAWVFRKGKDEENKYDRMLKFDGLKILSIHIDAISTKDGKVKIYDFISKSNNKCSVYMDESQNIKNGDSKRTTEAIKIGNLCKYKLNMTGTPLTKDIVDNFSQFEFLDPAIIGHKFVTTFKNYYCEFEQTNFGPRITGYRNLEELYRRIDPFVYRITADEALDLPPRVDIPIRFSLTDYQYELMDDLKRKFFTEFGDNETIFVKNAASLLTRLQQISCGYLPNEDKLTRTSFDQNPRLENLNRILDQRSDKVVIWCRFQYDVETVMREFGERAVPYYGDIKRDARRESKREFIQNDKILYFVGTAATGGTGLDGLQPVCSTTIYYSNSFDAEDRWQSEGRVRRDGTINDGINTNTYFDLIARRSPDLGILANLKKKKDISKLFYDDYRQLLEAE